MSGFLSKFSFEPEKIEGKMWWIVVAVWVLVLLCAVSSLFSRPLNLTSRQRMFWAAVMVFIPGLGLLAYLPFSHKREGFNFMKKPRSTKKAASPSS